MAMTFNYDRLRYQRLRSKKSKNEKPLSYAEQKRLDRAGSKTFRSKGR